MAKKPLPPHSVNREPPTNPPTVEMLLAESPEAGAAQSDTPLPPNAAELVAAPPVQKTDGLHTKVSPAVHTKTASGPPAPPPTVPTKKSGKKKVVTRKDGTAWYRQLAMLSPEYANLLEKLAGDTELQSYLAGQLLMNAIARLHGWPEPYQILPHSPAC